MKSIALEKKLVNWALLEMLTITVVSVIQVLVIKNMVLHKKMF